MRGAGVEAFLDLQRAGARSAMSSNTGTVSAIQRGLMLWIAAASVPPTSGHVQLVDANSCAFLVCCRLGQSSRLSWWPVCESHC